LVVLLVPNVLFELLRVPQTDEPWIRVLGVIAIALGVYFVSGARSEATSFLKGTVLGRLIIAAGATVLFALWGYWPAILFALAEAAGALWTWSALRRKKPAPATTPAT
jgi:energy-converting hydrogenase Eha subunit A